MTDLQIINAIETEFKTPTMGVTEQYLEIHTPVYRDGQLAIERIDREKEGQTIVYIPVTDEVFYFAVYLDEKKGQVIGLHTEPFYRIYFSATSETLTSDELIACTKLQPTEVWSKGDLRKTGKSYHTFSRFTLLPNPEPDEFEYKLSKLLTFLEQDKEGIKRLVKQSDCFISAVMNVHNSNGMLGGPNIELESIKRLSELSLPISFDIYLEGNPLR
jgi:hypothetical protein